MDLRPPSALGLRCKLLFQNLFLLYELAHSLIQSFLFILTCVMLTVAKGTIEAFSSLFETIMKSHRYSERYAAIDAFFNMYIFCEIHDHSIYSLRDLFSLIFIEATMMSPERHTSMSRMASSNPKILLTSKMIENMTISASRIDTLVFVFMSFDN